MTRLALHWFRNDLRLADNTALAEACAADRLAPVFVFDERLLRSAGPSAPRVRFLRECVAALARPSSAAAG